MFYSFCLNSEKLQRKCCKTHPSFLHPVVSAKPHNDMRPANRSVRVELGPSDSDVLIWQGAAVLAVMLQQRRYLGPKDQYDHGGE